MVAEADNCHGSIQEHGAQPRARALYTRKCQADKTREEYWLVSSLQWYIDRLFWRPPSASSIVEVSSTSIFS
jgi:hypothetical protein